MPPLGFAQGGHKFFKGGINFSSTLNVCKAWEAYRYLLADTRQATTRAVSELSSPEERSCTEKGRSQTALSNFLSCEVSLPPDASSNTGVAVQSSRSV